MAGLSLSHLDPSQREAVLHEQGPMLVLAGAGSGKTRVLTHRIAHLVLERGVLPEKILAVSFTNKAAEEMGERMIPLVGKDRAPKLWLSTFHSFGVRFAREESKALFQDRGRFSIFDQGDAVGLVREIVRREGIGDRKLDLWAVLARISVWKNKLLAPTEVRASEEIEYDRVALEVYPHYEAGLRSMRALDFDDLVVRPARLLRERPELREKWSSRFQHLLVDEFQDTNAAQLEIVKLLVGPLRNVCVVGDDDQAIYGWRGADVGNILDFDKLYPPTKIVKLERNYRSYAPILAVANNAISRATGKRHGKVLRATRIGGDRVRLVRVGTAEEEAKLVCSEIRQMRKEGREYGDMAVLYRSNLQARVVEEELRVEGIPLRVVGGQQFFEKKEVKDAIAYLRFAANPKDELALRRILNVPARGIGDVAVSRIETHALAKGKSFSKVALDPSAIDDLSDSARAGAARLAVAIERFQSRIEGPGLAAAALSYFDDTGLRADLETPPAPGEKSRWANVDFVLRSLQRWENRPEAERASLATFLQRLTVRQPEEEDGEPGNEVTLSSLHSSKGLEWPVVFFLGLNEGTLPHARTIDPKLSEASPTDVEEERRLFYVGVTRARERLYLCRPLRKEIRGKEIPSVPSRFLEGLDENELEVIERDAAQPVTMEETSANASSLLAMLKGL